MELYGVNGAVTPTLNPSLLQSLKTLTISLT